MDYAISPFLFSSIIKNRIAFTFFDILSFHIKGEKEHPSGIVTQGYYDPVKYDGMKKTKKNMKKIKDAIETVLLILAQVLMWGWVFMDAFK